MKKRKILQLNMFCVSCAGKLEKAISEMPGVGEVSMDYGAGRIYIEGEIDDDFMLNVNEIANELEPGASVTDPAKRKQTTKEVPKKNHSATSKRNLIISGIGVILFIVAIILHLVVFKLTNSSNGTVSFMGIWRDPNVWFVAPIYLASYLLLGHDVIWSAVKRIGTGDMFDENFLMSIATLGALVLGEFIEAVAVMLFYKIGEFFQDFAVLRSRKEINSLMDLRPEIATLKTANGYIQVHPEDLKVGDTIQVRVGESVPVDGTLVMGNSSLDVKHLTGESRPYDVYLKSEILSGSVNLTSVFEMTVGKDFSDSAVSKIIEFIETNADKKSKQEQFITKFSKIYTPVVVAIGLIVALVVPGVISLVNQAPYMNYLLEWIHSGLVFLVASCPCALVLGVPLSYFAGIGKAAKEGILIKSGSDLDELRRIKHVAFDKTGTITKGNFAVIKIEKAIDISDEEFLYLAAHAESTSNHLIAKSIVKAYGKKLDEQIIDQSDEISGQGLKTIVDGRTILIGNQRLMRENNVSFSSSKVVGTHVYMAVDNEYYGVVVIADEIKESSYAGIDLLNKSGIKTTMVTGDQAEIATDIANTLGITNHYSQRLPMDKVEIIKQIRLEEKVAFVGDGINDAPVLISSDIGFAMGGVGSDIAIESADVVLMNDDLRKVSHAIEISKRTNKIVTINISLTLIIKVVVLTLSIIFRKSPWMMGAAVFADVGASLIATLIAVSLLKTTRKDRAYNQPLPQRKVTT